MADPQLSSITTKISWGSNKYEAECTPVEGLDAFKAVLFSLTGVPPEKQKILYRKKALDDNVLTTLKNKARLKLIGTAESAPVQGDVTVVFAEDLSLADKAKLVNAMPPGLGNLGNTCYLNATVQCLKSIPEFRDGLMDFSQNSLNPSVSKALGALFVKMQNTEESFNPQMFVMLFRQAMPQFAEMDAQRRGYRQQDASEFFTELQQVVKRDQVSGGKLADELFGIEMLETLTCAQTDEVKTTPVSTMNLTCTVNRNISHLIFGLKANLVEEGMEKHSEQLGANALWNKEVSITSLPKYLVCNINRFQWKRIDGHDQGGENCKQLRAVKFPLKLDVSMLVHEDLRKRIMSYRQRKLDWEDEQREKRHDVGQDPDEKAEAQTQDPVQAQDANPAQAQDAMDIDSPPENSNNQNEEELEGMEVEEVDETGEYQLCGVVTHKGRTADSGHYIGYGKDDKTGQWCKFDDDVVTEVSEDDVKALYGGGDFQMGYICFYRQIEPVKLV